MSSKMKCSVKIIIKTKRVKMYHLTSKKNKAGPRPRHTYQFNYIVQIHHSHYDVNTFKTQFLFAGPNDIS